MYGTQADSSSTTDAENRTVSMQNFCLRAGRLASYVVGEAESSPGAAEERAGCETKATNLTGCL